MADAVAELSSAVSFRVSQKCDRVSQNCKGHQIVARRGRSNDDVLECLRKIMKNPYMKNIQICKLAYIIWIFTFESTDFS